MRWPARCRPPSCSPMRCCRRRCRAGSTAMGRAGCCRGPPRPARQACCSCWPVQCCGHRTGPCSLRRCWPAACPACRRWCARAGPRSTAAARNCRRPIRWRRCSMRSPSSPGRRCRSGCRWRYGRRPACSLPPCCWSSAWLYWCCSVAPNHRCRAARAPHRRAPCCDNRRSACSHC
ncbi:hypothetical protein D3C73_1043100 [compost metagenome]